MTFLALLESYLISHFIFGFLIGLLVFTPKIRTLIHEAVAETNATLPPVVYQLIFFLAAVAVGSFIIPLLTHALIDKHRRANRRQWKVIDYDGTPLLHSVKLSEAEAGARLISRIRQSQGINIIGTRIDETAYTLTLVRKQGE